jgi:hypothetical protein
MSKETNALPENEVIDEKKIIDKESTPVELTDREKEQEAIVCFSRDKIIPFLKDKNKDIESSKLMLDTLAVVIQQGMFEVMRKTTIRDLGLLEKIKENFPDAENYKELITLINNETMMMGTEVLQWTNEKIGALLKEENKKRNITDLNLEF